MGGGNAQATEGFMHRAIRPALIVAPLLLAACTGAPSPTNSHIPIQTARPTPEVASIVYLLSGSATGASITYTDSYGNIQQQTNIAVPLTTNDGKLTGLHFPARHGAFVQFSAQNNDDFGTLDCEIDANGTELNTGHASGGYAIVSCSAVVP
jgi:hypothetical protein